MAIYHETVEVDGITIRISHESTPDHLHVWFRVEDVTNGYLIHPRTTLPGHRAARYVERRAELAVGGER
ncbi:MAG: hypothetical protein AAFV53_37900 [Myxococcota bacterium]